jgi:hypothetical protein
MLLPGQPLLFLSAHGEAFGRVFSHSYKIVSHRTDAGELTSLSSLVPACLSTLPEIDRCRREDPVPTGKYQMKKLALALALGTIAITNPIASAFAAPTPCEDALKDLRAAEAAAKLSAADKTRVSELETKGIERCNADDDKRADDFFAQAMKVVGK